MYVDEEAPKANAEDTCDRAQQRISRVSLTPMTKHRSFSKSRDNISLSAKESGSSSDLDNTSTQEEQKSVPSALSIAAKQVSCHHKMMKKLFLSENCVHQGSTLTFLKVALASKLVKITRQCALFVSHKENINMLSSNNSTMFFKLYTF